MSIIIACKKKKEFSEGKSIYLVNISPRCFQLPDLIVLSPFHTGTLLVAPVTVASNHVVP